jgi:hypothetical protein
MKFTLSRIAVEKLDEYGIPHQMHGAIIRYVEKGIRPGDFLTAVINNDLFEAVGRADSENKLCLDAYVTWFYNQAPGGCAGRAGSVDSWIEHLNQEENHD